LFFWAHPPDACEVRACDNLYHVDKFNDLQRVFLPSSSLAVPHARGWFSSVFGVRPARARSYGRCCPLCQSMSAIPPACLGPLALSACWWLQTETGQVVVF